MNAMAAIEFAQDGITVDAAIIGEGLDLPPAAVQAGMREGRISSLCERGIGQDAGRYRLTFFYGTRRLRLVIDQTCNIVRRSVTEERPCGR